MTAPLRPKRPSATALDWAEGGRKIQRRLRRPSMRSFSEGNTSLVSVLGSQLWKDTVVADTTLGTLQSGAPADTAQSLDRLICRRWWHQRHQRNFSWHVKTSFNSSITSTTTRIVTQSTPIPMTRRIQPTLTGIRQTPTSSHCLLPALLFTAFFARAPTTQWVFPINGHLMLAKRLVFSTSTRSC